MGNVAAATNVNIWQGTCYLMPLVGAVLADAYWGRYWTIATFSTIYLIVIIDLVSHLIHCLFLSIASTTEEIIQKNFKKMETCS